MDKITFKRVHRAIFAFLVTLNFSGVLLQAAQQAEPSNSNVSSEDIFSATPLSEPLVPIGGIPTQRENVDVLNALNKFEQDFSTIQPLLDYLQSHPKSVWNGALLTNIGTIQFKSGFLSRAFDSYQQAWELMKNETSPKGKALADKTLGQLCALNARVGRTDEVKRLLGIADGRGVVGPATELIQAARESYGIMIARPDEAFRCGPLAVDKLVSLERPENATVGRSSRNRLEVHVPRHFIKAG